MWARRYSLLLVVVLAVTAFSFLHFCRPVPAPILEESPAPRGTSPTLQQQLDLYNLICRIEPVVELSYFWPINSDPITNYTSPEAWTFYEPRLFSEQGPEGDTFCAFSDATNRFVYAEVCTFRDRYIVTNEVEGDLVLEWVSDEWPVTNSMESSTPISLSRSVVVSKQQGDHKYEGTVTVWGRDCFRDKELTLAIGINSVVLTAKANLDSSVVLSLENKYAQMVSAGVFSEQYGPLNRDLLTEERVALADTEDWDITYAWWTGSEWAPFLPSFDEASVLALLSDDNGGVPEGATVVMEEGQKEGDWQRFYLYATPYLYGVARREIVQTVSSDGQGVTIPQVGDKVWPVAFSNTLPTCYALSSQTKFALRFDPSKNTNTLSIQTVVTPEVSQGFVVSNRSEKVTNTCTLLPEVSVQVGGDSFLYAPPEVVRWDVVEDPGDYEGQTNRYVIPILSPMTQQTEDVDGYDQLPVQPVPFSKRYDPEVITLSRGSEEELDYLYNLANYYGTNSVSFYVAVTNMPVFETNLLYRTVTSDDPSTNIFFNGGSTITNVALSHTFTNIIIWQKGGPRKGDSVLAVLKTSEPLYQLSGTALHCDGDFGWFPFVSFLSTEPKPGVSSEWIQGLSNRTARASFRRGLRGPSFYRRTRSRAVPVVTYTGSWTSNSYALAWSAAKQKAVNTAVTNTTDDQLFPYIETAVSKCTIIEGDPPQTNTYYSVDVSGRGPAFSVMADARASPTNVVWRERNYWEGAQWDKGLVQVYSGEGANDTFWTVGGDGVTSESVEEEELTKSFVIGSVLDFPSAWDDYQPDMAGLSISSTGVVYAVKYLIPADASLEFPAEE